MGREWSPHTAEKTEILGDYLAAFARATGSARTRVYIDLFAGSPGNRVRRSGEEFKGSVELAVAVDPAFTHMALCESDPELARTLRSFVETAGGAIGWWEVFEGDANTVVVDALVKLPTHAPTFALLDPDGLDLAWQSVVHLADHKRPAIQDAPDRVKTKVELWILFPISGIQRCLGAGLSSKVEFVYGARGPWSAVWAAKECGEVTPAEAGRALRFLYMDRLAELGYGNLLYRPVRNTRNELYDMIFATDSPIGDRLMGWAHSRPRIKRTFEPTLFPVASPTPDVEVWTPDWSATLPIELPPWEESR